MERFQEAAHAREVAHRDAGMFSCASCKVDREARHIHRRDTPPVFVRYTTAWNSPSPVCALCECLKQIQVLKCMMPAQLANYEGIVAKVANGGHHVRHDLPC